MNSCKYSSPCFLLCSIRILPHQQDTGGFFVAVLVKHSWLPWQRQGKKQPPSMPGAEGGSSAGGGEESASSDGTKQSEAVQSDTIAVGGDLQRPSEEVLGKSVCAHVLALSLFEIHCLVYTCLHTCLI